MRPRPVRPNLFKPVTRFGIVASDWKFILLVTLAGYLVPFVFDVRLFRVPLFLWAGLLCALLSYAFCFWARIGRRPYWLQHTARAFISSSVERRALPLDRKKRPLRSWLLDA